MADIKHLPGCEAPRYGIGNSCACASLNQFGRVPVGVDFYCWSLDEENYEGECPSRAAALEDGLSEMGLEEGDTLFTARIVRRTLADYLTDQFMEGVVESLQEAAYKEVGDHAEDWLNDVMVEHGRELDDELRRVLNRWARAHGYNPHFFTVTDVELYIVQPEDVPENGENDPPASEPESNNESLPRPP